tara:strand:- start:668 stop:1447 length:780 start_codon:yes stop_codon:yes gene_type:complete
MKKLLVLLIISNFLTLSSFAGSVGEEELKKKPTSEVKECFESVNRGIFAFNQAIDGLIFEPLAKGYLYLPSPIRTGTSNFVQNISTLLTIPNNLLQGNFESAGKNTARFVLNTTVGVVGLFDPATRLGINNYQKEDFGQTLGTYGVGEGCYLVLPILGPSTARDSIASLGNYLGGDAWYNVTVRNDTHYFSDFDYYGTKGAEGIDFRAKNFDDINNLEENSMDFYASVKSLYLQDRRKKILNAKGITETQNDSDWEEIE